MDEQDHKHFMREAIRLSKEGMDNNQGGPFGAVVVKNGQIVGRGYNKVTLLNDPTAHAEVTAIRDACNQLGTFQLDNCIIYTSCEPCPMCLGAIYWARPDAVYYANDRKDAADIGFDDDFIYTEINMKLDERKIPMLSVLREEAIKVFQAWQEKGDKTLY
ncbi:MAG: nucleoside deaminase [Flavobacteriales bacterium]